MFRTETRYTKMELDNVFPLISFSFLNHRLIKNCFDEVDQKSFQFYLYSSPPPFLLQHFGVVTDYGVRVLAGQAGVHELR